MIAESLEVPLGVPKSFCLQRSAPVESWNHQLEMVIRFPLGVGMLQLLDQIPIPTICFEQQINTVHFILAKQRNYYYFLNSKSYKLVKIEF